MILLHGSQINLKLSLLKKEFGIQPKIILLLKLISKINYHPIKKVKKHIRCGKKSINSNCRSKVKLKIYNRFVKENSFFKKEGILGMDINNKKEVNILNLKIGRKQLIKILKKEENYEFIGLVI